jgi:hypothetical protein
MIGPAQVVNGFWMGMVLIALGLIPGLFQNLTDSLRKIIGRTLPIPISSRWQTQVQPVELKQQLWLVVLGWAILAATMILYFAD